MKDIKLSIFLVMMMAFCALPMSANGDSVPDKRSIIADIIRSIEDAKPDKGWRYVSDQGNNVSSSTQGCYYEYDNYVIRFTAEPSAAVVLWNGKEIGKTPLRYQYSGKLYTDESLVITVKPLDPKYLQKKANINLYMRPPQLIHFDIDKE